ncbi:MAG: transporter substrate-binding domain-containing protein [Prolixibacteraceae bacterium]|nr:transporter substrate-binding domain-containing protein [Prolixibacteraceae bacterium]
MKHFAFTVPALIALFLISSCKKDETGSSTLRIICEELRPYSYVENDELKGISVEITDSILGCLGEHSKTIEVTTDWDGAFDDLKKSDDIVLFTTIMTTERKEQLQWVGPVMLSTSGFVSLSSKNYQISGLSDAKNLNAIGVVTGYSTLEILEDEGFTNTVYYSTIDEAIAALFNEEIDAVFDLTEAVVAIAKANGHNSSQLSTTYKYSTMQGFLAFSPGVSDETINIWQEKLDWLKAEGFVQKIYDKYLPGEKAPGLLTIYTEENPPQSYTGENGQLTGSSVEMVEALMQELDNNDPIIVNNWTQGYNQALLVPNSIVFSTLRNDDREAIFNWIGPLCRKSYCFFVKSESTVSLSELNDAKNLGAVGVPEGWASESELIEAGFTNLQSGLTPAIVFEMLMDGTVDAAVLNDIAIESLASELGYDASGVRNELVLSTGDTYMAFNIETKSDYFQQWEQAFNTLVENGTYDAIWSKWYPGIEPPR